MLLGNYSILIVESDIGPFILALQGAIEQAGAETVVARDPASAMERKQRFQFSAAAVNVEHRSLVSELGIPILFYGPGETPPAPKAIVSGLVRLLAADA